MNVRLPTILALNFDITQEITLNIIEDTFSIGFLPKNHPQDLWNCLNVFFQVKLVGLAKFIM